MFGMTTRFLKFARCLLQDRSGNVAIMFGIAIIPLLGFIGGSIDYGNSLRLRTQLQQALDASTLAAAREIQNGKSKADARKVADGYLEATFPMKDFKTSHKLQVNDKKAFVEGVASAEVPTYILSVLGISQFKVSVSSVVSTASEELEVALVLDNTGSMSGEKIETLRDAAKQLTEALMPETRGDYVKIALIPFSDYVNIGESNRHERGVFIPRDYEVERPARCWNTYPDSTETCDKRQVSATCYNDGVPYACTRTEYYNCTGDKGDPVEKCDSGSRARYRWYGCVASRAAPLNTRDDSYFDRVPGVMSTGDNCHASEVIRLTNRKRDILRGIQDMEARGETYIPSGLIWGWRALSSGIPFADGAGRSKKVNKAIILMTDGANVRSMRKRSGEDTEENEGRFIWSHTGGDEDEANDLTSRLCENIKSENIAIYAIAFDIEDTGIKDLMSNCAGAGGSYFDPEKSVDLLRTFAEIAYALNNLRLTH